MTARTTSPLPHAANPDASTDPSDGAPIRTVTAIDVPDDVRDRAMPLVRAATGLAILSGHPAAIAVENAWIGSGSVAEVAGTLRHFNFTDQARKVELHADDGIVVAVALADGNTLCAIMLPESGGDA